MEFTEKQLAKKMREKMASDRENQRIWRAKQKASGKRSMTVLLSDEVYAILTKIKTDTGKNFAEIIEDAVKALEKNDS